MIKLIHDVLQKCSIIHIVPIISTCILVSTILQQEHLSFDHIQLESLFNLV